jgi:hypothetical protein
VLDRRGDDAKVLGDDRQLAQLGLGRVERRAPGPTDPPPRPGIGRPAGDRPVRHEAAEVVHPRQVEEVEGAAEALDPEAVAAAAHRRPVVDRVAPELALLREVVRRRARDDVVAEELGVGLVVGAAGRDVDRHVADEAHPVVGGVRAQIRPFAIEADLVVDGPFSARECGPIVDPRRVLLPERGDLVVTDRGRAVGEQPGPGRESRAGLVR